MLPVGRLSKQPSCSVSLPESVPTSLTHSNDILVRALEQHLSCVVRRLHFPKSVLQQLEPFENIRRATLYDASTGTKRRWTNARMVTDTKAMSELQFRDQYDERPASGYNQTLPDGTTFALGYSSERGKIFFSRDLTVTQMRAWAPEKIRDVLNAVEGSRATNPIAFVRLASPEILKRIPVAVREVIEDVARAIMECRTQNLSVTELHRDSLACYIALSSARVSVSLRVDCETCQEPSEIRCVSCQESSIEPRDGRLVCSSCGQIVDPQRIECLDGHSNVTESISELVHLIPLSNLRGWVVELVEAATGQRVNLDEEFFFIRGNRLFFQSANIKVVYTIGDIPELAALLPGNVPDSERGRISVALSLFKEKYKCMKTENCANCVANRHHGRCYLRLFGLFDPDNIPHPHEGHEYGDYSRIVTLDGQQKQLVVALKSGSPSARPIKQRQLKGQDIYSQVGGYFHHGTKDIIGICVPQRLEDSFRSMLRVQAHSAHKRLLFIDDQDLCRVVYGVMQRHSLTLDQL